MLNARLDGIFKLLASPHILCIVSVHSSPEKPAASIRRAALSGVNTHIVRHTAGNVGITLCLSNYGRTSRFARKSLIATAFSSQNANLTSLISYPSPGLHISGTYAEVHQGELKGSGKRRLVAVKSYKPMSNEKTGLEIELLSGLPHHNVVPFLGFKDNGPSISIVMPWMSDGTLTSFIRTHGEAIETVTKSTLLHDIASGLQHRMLLFYVMEKLKQAVATKVHSNFVVHGNLESDNVLINEQHRACLSGFRQSVKLSSREAECPRSQMPRKPAIQFAGPEWFVRNDKRFQPLSQALFKSDVYSLGCVIFYIFTRCMPWYDAISTDISDKLRQCVTPSRPKGSVIDDRQWTLIKPCLSPLPQNRPSTSHLLKDIKGYLVSVGPRDLSGQIKLSRHGAVDRGGFGAIYEGIWSRKTGGDIKVAIKVLHIRNRLPMELARIEETLKRELAAWRRLSHPNILSLLGTTTDIGQDGIKAMVSLWIENGSLEQYMRVKSGVLTPSQRLHWAKDVAGGLKYLHEYPIVHGDLTPANVLIDDEERAVLTDFGLSIILGGFPDVSCVYTDGKTGTVTWAAPELFIDEKSLNRDVQSPSPKPASDVYSFACLMYLIFSGHQPWVVRGNAELAIFINNLRNGKRPSNPGNIIEARYWGLIVQCWSAAPDSRPMISDVLKRLQ